MSQPRLDIVQIISTHKRIKRVQADGKATTPVRPGMKRVQAILRYRGELYTRHVDVPASRI